MDRFQAIHEQAVKLLQDLCTPNGILASLIEADNYKRIWARDSIVCGLAGIFLEDDKIIEGLKNSLITLAKGQHKLGMIPSNVDPEDISNVSYGSLAGRVDTNTWFIIGVSLYVKHTNDVNFLSQMEQAVHKCRKYLRSIELNDRGWIYTPLSGNWADEYPVQGYTLYDNCLRIWAESLWHNIDEDGSKFPSDLIEKTRINFWPDNSDKDELIYHSTAYRVASDQNNGYYFSYLLPGNYDNRFDAAGNALALLILGLDGKKRADTKAWLKQMDAEVRCPLVPAFWPVIDETDSDWKLLENNYSYEFKNRPGYFHNGGIWPVWMGLYCLALSMQGLKEEAIYIIDCFTDLVVKKPEWDFHEYIESNNFQLGGKVKMGYTASGIVFMGLAQRDLGKISSLFAS